jgi:hypothetical protein
VPIEISEITSEVYLNSTLRNHFEAASLALASVEFAYASLMSMHVDKSSPSPISVCDTGTCLLVAFHIANSMFVEYVQLKVING